MVTNETKKKRNIRQDYVLTNISRRFLHFSRNKQQRATSMRIPIKMLIAILIHIISSLNPLQDWPAINKEKVKNKRSESDTKWLHGAGACIVAQCTVSRMYLHTTYVTVAVTMVSSYIGTPTGSNLFFILINKTRRRERYYYSIFNNNTTLTFKYPTVYKSNLCIMSHKLKSSLQRSPFSQRQSNKR